MYDTSVHVVLQYIYVLKIIFGSSYQVGIPYVASLAPSYTTCTDRYHYQNS